LNTEGREILKQAASLSPSFFAIGGDIGYANAFSSCYYRWDQFFRDVETLLVTPSGHMIPILTCIGNHEAESSLFDQKRSSAIDYIIYFSHEIGKSDSSRNLYHYHK
jgi:acid phosphatase type 7